MHHIVEIDHIVDEFFSFIVESIPDYDFSGIALVENRMGISFGLFDTLYSPCKKAVMRAQDLTDDEFANQFEEIYLSSKIILCLNGEMNSAVNRRLRMLKMGLISDLQEELHFVGLVSFKFKKAGILWYYRQMLIRKLFEKEGEGKRVLLHTLESENALLEDFFKKFPRNYYGWGYKKFLIDEFIVKPGHIDILWSEYIRVKEYCERHVHDYCAFHLLGYIALKLSRAEKGRNIKEEEKIWAEDLMHRYEELYLLEKLEINDKGVQYHQLESIKIFMRILEKS